MFLERLFMDPFIIDEMLHEDKLKEISVKLVWAKIQIIGIQCFHLALRQQTLNSLKGTPFMRLIKLFHKFCVELQWNLMVEIYIRFI